MLQFGSTPAHVASLYGHANCLEVLGRLAPSSLNVVDEVCMLCFLCHVLVFQVGRTPAHVASMMGHADCLKVLSRFAAEFF